MTASFKRTKIKHKTLGQTLLLARIKQKLEIRQIANELNIKVAYLEALEKGRFSDLPADVYSKGFLKRYAAHLQLDPVYVTRLFTKEKKIHSHLLEQDKPKVKPKSSTRKALGILRISPKAIKVLVFVALIVALGVYLVYQLLGFSGVPWLEVYGPTNNSVTENRSVLVTGKTEVGNDILINNQSVLPGDDGSWQEMLDLHEGVNTFKIIARNKLGKTIEVVRNVRLEEEVVNQDLPQIAGDSDSNAEESDSNIFTIEVKQEDTWVNLIVDNNEVFSGIFTAGDRKEFTVNEQVSITTGKAGFTFITWQGEDLGSLGEPNEVVRDRVFKIE